MTSLLRKKIVRGKTNQQNIRKPDERKLNFDKCNKGNLNFYQKISGIRKYISTENGEEKFFNCNFVVASKENVVVTYNDVLLDLDDCEILEITNKIFSRCGKGMHKNHAERTNPKTSVI